MPDWMSWLHMPKLSDSEYAIQKEAYTAKHGYTVTIPGLSDIIHIGKPPPITQQEYIMYKRRDWDWFPPKRLDEIKKMKQRKKDTYMAMLGSPTPYMVQNLGSILTAIDDAQDAVSTLAVVGTIAKNVLPKVIGKALLGPVGVLWIVSDVLNLMQSAPYACLKRRPSKRAMEAMSKHTPKQIRARAKRVPRLEMKSPRMGDWIQAAQVTDQIFGVGISLGPLVGLAQDILFGMARSAAGEPVKIKLPLKGITNWGRKAYRSIKSLGAVLTYPVLTDDEDILTWFSASTLAFQYLHDDIQDWHPLDMIDDPLHVEVRAPVPQDPLTIEVIQEGPIPFAETIGWPQTNKLWSTVEELADATRWGVTENLERFILRNKHSFMGHWAASTAVESSMFALATIESEEVISYDYKPSGKIATKMTGAGLYLDPAQPPAKIRDFAGYMYQNDKDDYNPTVKEITNYCNGPAGIKLKEYPS